MSEYSLESPRLWRALEGWAFRQYIDAYIERLQAEGFSNRHTFHALRTVGEYARWLTDHHGDDIDVHENTIAAFTGWPRVPQIANSVLRHSGVQPPLMLAMRFNRASSLYISGFERSNCRAAVEAHRLRKRNAAIPMPAPSN